MINGLAILLATLMIPTVQSNAVMSEKYSAGEPQSYIQQANNETAKIYTPNGSEITVTCPLDIAVDEDVWHERTYFFVSTDNVSELPKISGWYKNFDGEDVTLKDMGILRKGDPTETYNNLAFAFYMYWEKGEYFDFAMHCELNSIEPYIEDFSYTVVKDEPAIDDIVLYYNAAGRIQTAGIINEVYANEASNVASNETFVRQLSKYKIWSKWNEYGVYEHRGDLCPFVSKYATPKVTETATANVVYLRRHIHSFTVVEGSDSGTMHTVQCSECGMTKTVNHSYTHRYTPYGNSFKWHYAFCICGVKKTESHTMKTFNNGVTSYTFCGKCFWSLTDVSTQNFLALNFKEFIESLQNK